MKTIHKYHLPLESLASVHMPIEAQVLCVGEQFGNLFLWAEIDTASPSEERCFCVFGTGYELPARLGKHIGTVHMKTGLVWHVYDALSQGR